MNPHDPHSRQGAEQGNPPNLQRSYIESVSNLSSSCCWLLDMKDVGVLMTCPMSTYLEQELEKRFKLFKLWAYSSADQFLKADANSVRALVGDTKIGADAKLIDSLPKLEIVASYSVGLDKIDLNKCGQKGIRVTNTPDVLTDDVADIAIGLILAVLRRLCVSDGFVRNGSWKDGVFGLTTKVGSSLISASAIGCLLVLLNHALFSISKFSNLCDAFCLVH